MVLAQLDISSEKNEVGPPTSHYIKYLKWIKDLNVRTKISKLIERKNRNVNSHDLGLSNSFLDMILKTQATKEKMN